MAWTWDDRWLWLGLAAILLASSQGVAYALSDTSRLAGINHPNITKATPENDVEDAISLEALHTLSRSVNPDIAHAATSLLISRFALSDVSCDALTLELFSPFPQTRQRAKQVLELIDSHPLTPEFQRPDVLRVERVQELRNVSKSSIKTQSMCMAFFKSFGPLSQGIGSLAGVAEAVEVASRGPSFASSSSSSRGASLVRSSMRAIVVDEPNSGVDLSQGRLWAAPGNEGSPAQLGDRRANNVVLPPISTVGVEQLEGRMWTNPRSEANLESLAQLLSRGNGAVLPQGQNVTGESLAQLIARGDSAVLPLGRNVDGPRRARFHEESPEETEVRRRRREAMVFHEGSGALAREDIIHPRTRMP